MTLSSQPGQRDAFPSPWRSLRGATATAAALGLSLVGAAFVLPGSNVGLLAPGIAVAVAMGGAWMFARSRAELIEPELQRLRRGDAVAQWEMEPQQWVDFSRGKRARARAWVLGGAAGLSILPVLLLVVLLIGPAEARGAAGWIAWGLACLWALALAGGILTGRMKRTPRPVMFTPKLCAVGGTIYAWPRGIARIELDEANGIVFITRKGGPWMPARTFAIPVPERSFEEARSLLSS